MQLETELLKKEYYREDGRILSINIKNNTKLLDNLMNRTAYLKDNATISERVYNVSHNLPEVPHCEMCDKPTKFENAKKGYKAHCSLKCSRINPKTLEKFKQTCVKNLGVQFPSQSHIVQSKSKATNNEKYGSDFYVQTNEFLDQSSKTKLSRYGDGKYTNRQKAIETFSNNYVKSTEFNKSHHSRKNITQEIDDKLSNTLWLAEQIQKIGIEKVAKMLKVSRTYVQKFCTLNNIPTNTHKHKGVNEHIISLLNNKVWLNNQHTILKRSTIEISNELNVSRDVVLKYLHKHSIDIIKSNVSQAEIDVCENIKSYFNNIEVVSNTRTVIPPKEIDMYLPEHKLAIEFNGIYWHSPDKMGGFENWFKYHNDKIISCSNIGITLLYVWENHTDYIPLIEKFISNKEPIDNNLIGISNNLYNLTN